MQTNTPTDRRLETPLFDTLRQTIQTEGADLQEKLWGSARSLRQTAEFVTAAELDI